MARYTIYNYAEDVLSQWEEIIHRVGYAWLDRLDPEDVYNEESSEDDIEILNKFIDVISDGKLSLPGEREHQDEDINEPGENLPQNYWITKDEDGEQEEKLRVIQSAAEGYEDCDTFRKIAQIMIDNGW